MTTTTAAATASGPNLTVQAAPVDRVIFARRDSGVVLALVPLSLHRDETIRQADALLREGEREPFLAELEALYTDAAREVTR